MLIRHKQTQREIGWDKWETIFKTGVGPQTIITEWWKGNDMALRFISFPKNDEANHRSIGPRPGIGLCGAYKQHRKLVTVYRRPLLIKAYTANLLKEL